MLAVLIVTPIIMRNVLVSGCSPTSMLSAHPDPFHAYPWPHHQATAADQERKTEVVQPADEEGQLIKHPPAVTATLRVTTAKSLLFRFPPKPLRLITAANHEEERKTEIIQPREKQLFQHPRANIKTISEILRKALTKSFKTVNQLKAKTMTVAHPKSTEDVTWPRSSPEYKGKKRNPTATPFLGELRWGMYL